MAWLPSLPSLGQEVAPTDDATAQLMLKRKLAMADALRNQEMPQGQMVSGHYVAPSWTQYLGNLANKWVSGQQENEAIKGYQDYLSGQQKTKQDALTALSKALSPQAITEQGSYDIQVPNGRTPTPTDNLGGMQPYESGMKTISVPMTTTTGTRNPTPTDALSAISAYANATKNPDLAEKLIMTQAGQIMAPKQTEWKEANGKLYGFDIHGNRIPGAVIGEGKPTNYGTDANASAQALYGKDFHELGQVEQRKVMDYVNQFKIQSGNIAQQGLNIRERAENPLGIPSPSKSSSGGLNVLNIPHTNSKGWTLHTDKNGNRAYVSPDGKSFEEVK